MKTLLQKIAILIICICCALSLKAQQTGFIVSVKSPQGGLYPGAYYHLETWIKNDTTFTSDSVSLSYSLNGVVVGSTSYHLSIMPSFTASIIFPDSFQIVSGNNDLCIMVDSVNGVATYDTTCYTLLGVTSAITLPYFDNFDGANNGWFQTPSIFNNTQWELGTPNYGATNSTHSGTNCWDINLNSAYDSNATAYLYSPVFDFTNAVNWKLSFWLNYNVEFSWDGTIMEYSTNGGNTWTRLGTAWDLNAINWYTTDLFGSLNGWFGNSYGWKKSYYTLSELNNAGWVQFRYIFNSDPTVNSDGVSVDDFSIDTCTLGATTIVSGNISCYGSCDGSLSSTVSGGVPPYNFAWSNGASTPNISSICAGTYTVSVTDANGCSTQSGIEISDGVPIWIRPQELFNCISLYDSAYFQIISGTPPYNFLWSTGNTTNYVLNPGIGIYTITVSDATGCTATSSINITGAPSVSYKEISEPSCHGYMGMVLLFPNGVPPLSYFWSDGSTSQGLFAVGGIYTVTITDAVGCSYSETDTLVDPPQINIIIDSVIASGCGTSDGSFYFSTNLVTYTLYVNGVQFGSTNNLAAGSYSLYVTDSLLCMSATMQIVVPDSCVDVYPGDANYDLVADNKDLLQIGLAYGSTGPVRPGASNTWIAQACPDWSNWFNIGINHKHADCDGNGLIDANDTIPVLLNYGLTHPLKPIIIPQINTVAPDLYLVISNDTIGLSDLLYVDVYFGTAGSPVDSIYGLAFTLNFDSALTDASTGLYNINNTFMGIPGIDVISINRIFEAGYADFAITRTDHQNVSGNGLVCRFVIVTADSISASTVLNFSLSNVSGITANDNPIMLDAFGDSIFGDSNLTAINNPSWAREVKLYPNPANNYFTVASSLTNISKISMLNQFGEVIYKNEKPRLPQRINVSNITNGIYFLRIECKEGVMYRKIEIIR